MIKSQLSLLVATLFACVAVHGSPLESLADEDLSGVVAQQGVAVDLDFFLNSDPATGAPLASLGSCTGTTSANGCRIGLQFNNRLNGGGEWLALKDVYGSIQVRDLWIDGAFSQTTASPYANDSRFLDGTGTVCLPSGGAAAGCAAQVLNDPLLQLSFKSAEASGTSYVTFEPDIQYHLNVGRMAVEYGANGYAADARGSFMGILVSDTQQLRAKIDIDGRIFMSGF